MERKQQSQYDLDIVGQDEIVLKTDRGTVPDHVDKLDSGHRYLKRSAQPREALEDMPVRAIRNLTARVRGKIVYQGKPTPGAWSQLDELMREHGRHLHITAKLIDGSKRRYRGNVRVS